MWLFGWLCGEKGEYCPVAERAQTYDGLKHTLIYVMLVLTMYLISLYIFMIQNCGSSTIYIHLELQSIIFKARLNNTSKAKRI